MQLLAGRNLRASDTLNEFVINETAVRAFGFKSAGDALGKMIGPSDAQFPVVGVVKDFHQQNFYQAIDPMAFESEKSRLLNFNIRLPANHSQWQKIIKQLEKQWYLIYPPESFKYTFYDDMIAGMYKQEQNLAKLVQVATVISIIISCLGLFGLAVLTAFQRTKEIGIRKVLGATIASIVSLLSREYVYLIAIAFAIATPLTIWAAGKWLQNFAYRVQPNWWTFALAGLIAIKAAIANPVKSLRSE
jgi:ABC-type antimicrobial peptide transport system permease subunit